MRCALLHRDGVHQRTDTVGRPKQEPQPEGIEHERLDENPVSGPPRRNYLRRRGRSPGQGPGRLRSADPRDPVLCSHGERWQKAAEKFGVEYIQQGPTSTNAADQLRIFESFVNQGVNVVGVSPDDVETLKPAIAKARQQGVHVITSDADAAGSEREFYVAQAMDKDLGFTILDEMVKRIGKTGKIAIISNSPTIASLNAWIAAI